VLFSLWRRMQLGFSAGDGSRFLLLFFCFIFSSGFVGLVLRRECCVALGGCELVLLLQPYFAGS
jgi:hypothetical protein